MSPYLFTLAVEVLASAVRQDQRIKGFTFEDDELNLLQYADDTTGTLADLESAKHFMEAVQTFGAYSGLQLNKEKTRNVDRF